MHTFIRRAFPLTITRTLCTLGAQMRWLLRLEWLTLLPFIVPFSQISQNLPMEILLLVESNTSSLCMISRSTTNCKGFSHKWKIGFLISERLNFHFLSLPTHVYFLILDRFVYLIRRCMRKRNIFIHKMWKFFEENDILS